MKEKEPTIHWLTDPGDSIFLNGPGNQMIRVDFLTKWHSDKRTTEPMVKITLDAPPEKTKQC